jgi:hypothetical protein
LDCIHKLEFFHVLIWTDFYTDLNLNSTLNIPTQKLVLKHEFADPKIKT